MDKDIRTGIDIGTRIDTDIGTGIRIDTGIDTRIGTDIGTGIRIDIDTGTRIGIRTDKGRGNLHLYLSPARLGQVVENSSHRSSAQ